MSQPQNIAFNTSPSRRGTPSTNEPIPYFSNAGADSAASADFYNMLNSSAPTAYQQTPASTHPNAPLQPATYYGQHQQAQSAQHLPYGVPPRCATGPAVETPYQNYAYSANSSYPAAYGADPYRSASVVYGGTYNGFQYSHQPVSANATAPARAPNDTAFFDQFVSSAASGAAVPQSAAVSEQPPVSTGYADGAQHGGQYATTAAYADMAYSAANMGNAMEPENAQYAGASNAAGDSANNGVVFDEASGQYYDVNSGQYYDEASATWYYPQQTMPAEALASAPAPDPQVVSAAQNVLSPEPVNAIDGAAFFDNLNDTTPESVLPQSSEQNSLTSAAYEHPLNPPLVLQGALSAATEAVSSTIADDLMLAEEPPEPVQPEEPVGIAGTPTHADSGADAAAGTSQPVLDSSSPHLPSTSPAVIAGSDPLYSHVSTVGIDEDTIFSTSMPEDTEVDNVPADLVSPVGDEGPTVTAEPAFPHGSAVDQFRAISAVQEVPIEANMSQATSPAYRGDAQPDYYNSGGLAENQHASAAVVPTHTDVAVVESVQEYAPSNELVDAATTSFIDTTQYYSQSYDTAPAPAAEATMTSAAAVVTAFSETSQFYNQSYGAVLEPAIEATATAGSQAETAQYYSQSYDTAPALEAEATTTSAAAVVTAFSETSQFYNQSYGAVLEPAIEATATAGSQAETAQYYSQSYDTAPAPAAAPAAATLGYDSLDAQSVHAGQGGTTPYAANYGAYGEEAMEQDAALVEHSQDQAYAEYNAHTDRYADGTGYQAVEANFQGYSDGAYATYANGYAGGYSEAATSASGVAMYSTAPNETSGMVQDMHGMANGAADSGAFLQSSSFELVGSIDKASTDPAYYERDPSMAAAGAEPSADPLGRMTARCPIAAFGFGGQLITMFPRQVQRFNDYSGGGALKIAPGMLSVQPLSQLIPQEHSAQCLLAAGLMPLLTGDTTRAALAKRRDAAIGCATALLGEPAFAGTLSMEEQALYGVSIAVLRVADQPDFQKLSLDEAAAAIRPLFAERPLEAEGAMAIAQSPAGEQERVAGAGEDRPAIVHGSAAELRDLEDLLLSGRRSEAISFTRARGMWAHALIIASCTGKDDWQAIVAAYAESAMCRNLAALGAQYRLFAGLGDRAFTDASASTESDFVTAAEIGGEEQHAPAGSSAVDDWARTLALALANRTPGDDCAILALGDRLRERGQVLAAHICYVLTLHSKDIFHGTEAGPRAVLLGVDERAHSNDGTSYEMAFSRFSRFYRKPAALFLTELYELAFVLKNAPNDSAAAGTPGAAKKPAPLLCLPHLQAYKLAHAWWLVDCGQLALASQYCDALLGILAALPAGTAVPFIHASLVQELRCLRERLTGSGMTPIKAAEMAGDDSALAGASPKSWLARAVPRPSFTSLMTVFDSSIDKFITGADGSRISLESSATPGKFEVGPSRHTPLPTGQSARPLTLGAEPHIYSDGRAASYASPRQSLDARPSTTATPVGYAEPPRMYTPSTFGSAAHPTPPPMQPPAPQWGDPGSMATHAAQDDFIVPGMAFGGASTNGFVAGAGFSGASPAHMPDYAPSQNHAPSQNYDSSQNYAPSTSQPVPNAGLNEEEDMFGFSRKKTPAQPGPSSARPSVDAARSKPPSARQSIDTKDARSRSDSQTEGKEASGVMGILKSFWGGRKNQANLGEESNFVFDPVLKRWVDKNAPAAQQDTGPPPPPPPSMMKFQPHAPPAQPVVNMYSAAAPVPPLPQGIAAAAFGAMNDARSSSAAPPMASGDSSRSGTPMSTPDIGTLGGMPPASAGARAGAAGKRRGARSRYVDVLNQ